MTGTLERELNAILDNLNRICRHCGLDEKVDQEEDKTDVREDSKDRDRYQQDE